jgi:hypothetical protein
MCSVSRSVNACCAWVQAPSVHSELTRAVGLHQYSTAAPSPVDLSCLKPADAAGPPVSHTATLDGYVTIFASQNDTAGVVVTVYTADPQTGVLGPMASGIGTYLTTNTDSSRSNTWLAACVDTPCTFRHYSIPNVPTETPLVIQTSDGGGGIWSTLYDYDVYFSNDATCDSAAPGAPCISSSGAAWGVHYDVAAVTTQDMQNLATSTGGFAFDPTTGILVGEVHDCGDIRLEGANVDTDQGHVGPIVDLDPPESGPLPDPGRAGSDQGTSALGSFVALNMAPGIPIRVSAIGNYGGNDTLVGTSVVQTFAGSMTQVRLRGRRPEQ